MNLYRIKAPAFEAGFCVDARNDVWEAAPAIKWMKDKPLSFITEYCKKKQWTLNAVSQERI